MGLIPFIMILRKCELDECGKEFKPHSANLKRGHGKFCSTKCWARYRHNKSLVTKTCNVCRAVFRGKKKRKVCSKKCGTKWMVISRKQRTTYRKKLIIGNLSKVEESIIRNLREMPEMTPKITEILNARKTAIMAFGKFTKKGVKNG